MPSLFVLVTITRQKMEIFRVVMKVRVDEKSSKRGIPSILGRFSSFYFLVASPGTEMNVNFHNTDRKKKKIDNGF